MCVRIRNFGSLEVAMMHELREITQLLVLTTMVGCAAVLMHVRYVRLRRNLLLKAKLSALLCSDECFRDMVDDYLKADGEADKRFKLETITHYVINKVKSDLVASHEERLWLQSGLSQPSVKGRERYLGSLANRDLVHAR